MLPNTKDAPASGAKCAGDEAVACLVAGDLGLPEFRVGLRLSGVDRTAVPEAAVHENRLFELGEDEVGFAEDRGFPPPSGNAVGFEDADQPQLGVLVARALDARHHIRALRFDPDIGHIKIKT